MLLLDEPTSYLDVRSQLDVLQLLRREARERGTAVVASLHEIDLAQKAADHVICVHDGHIMCQGTPDEVFTAERVAELYDLAPGAYDPAFGSVELARPEGDPEVFVIAGGGTGAACFRRLAREESTRAWFWARRTSRACLASSESPLVGNSRAIATLTRASQMSPSSSCTPFMRAPSATASGPSSSAKLSPT